MSSLRSGKGALTISKASPAKLREITQKSRISRATTKQYATDTGRSRKYSDTVPF